MKKPIEVLNKGLVEPTEKRLRDDEGWRWPRLDGWFEGCPTCELTSSDERPHTMSIR